MLSDEMIDKIIERLLQRVEQANTYFLKQLGKKVKQIGTLKTNDAHKLEQMLKYGKDYDEIVKQLAKYTDLNIKDIDKIFKEFSKKDHSFSKQFYEYRDTPYIPYDENEVLKRQTESLARLVKNEMYNFTRSNVLGYAIRDASSEIVKFMPLRETYNKVLDEAMLTVTQGKETFDSAMARILKDIGGSGLRTIEYESGRHIRLDSAIRMHLQGRMRELHNENQELFGKEFNADGVEISVHANPAPDHELVQGRQFSKEEYAKLQAGNNAVDYKGNVYNLDHDDKNGYRPISEMNCYHYVFAIVLGISEPEYSDNELQQIIDDNNKGFELDGKHYSMYEGTQMQRNLERKIREQKDIQILAKESDNKELIADSQAKITIYSKKYKQLSQASGLPTKANRLKVSGYKRVKISKQNTSNNNDTERLANARKVLKVESSAKDNINYEQFIDFQPKTQQDLEEIGKKYFNFKSNNELEEYISKTSKIKERIQSGDVELKKRLDIIEPKIDELAEESPVYFKMYSAKDINTDYTQSKHILSGTISKSIANIHVNKRTNKEIITIYVEKGANIVSTYNTSSKHFNRQGEIILPTKRKMTRIDKYNYILHK